MSWLFIGAGNMARSLIGGLLEGGDAASSGIAVVDPDEQACERARNDFGIVAATSLAAAWDVLVDEQSSAMPGFVIAVKPHIVEAACVSISECLQNNQNTETRNRAPLVISVAAGVRTQSMRNWLPHDCAVVRCMPNTPALLGLGASALFAIETCTCEHKELASQLLDSAGMSVWVDEESALDAVTAVSGSGPAYFFYLIEHMIESGIALGLERETAMNLAIETAYGAASMARTGELEPQVLRENVTSRGGTTAAALAVFEERNTPDIINSAMRAAHRRAEELGKSQ